MMAYVSGERAAFEQLFSLLAPPVHAFFLRCFRDVASADELLQETFLKVHRGRASYRPELPLRPWVFTIAAHVRRDEIRRRRRIKEECDEEQLAAADEAEAIEQAALADDGSADAAQQVREALDRLPESQRVVVHLHRYEGMTFGEIAKVLGTSEVAVRARAFRAYEQLRRALASLSSGRRSL
jgi:RNA polymerase sigma-70 factor (ECF subfamily)